MTEQIAIGQAAPDFELTDVQGNTVRLSDYRGERHVLLVFTRGFM
jgi:peroxiredoxin